MTSPTLHIVHCIDTEGPLTEPISASFDRINSIFGVQIQATIENLVKLQNQQIPLNGLEQEIALVLQPKLLAYNNNWDAIEAMLDDAMSRPFRDQKLDDFGQGWAYSWHIMDHVGYSSNPRGKALGFGTVFDFYRRMARKIPFPNDELNWHFHPVYPDGNPLKASTSYTNSYPLLNEILAHRLLDYGWFPVCNRPGFHSERPDSHAFLEQWIPLDYANQSYEAESGQFDLRDGRYGDWRRAPKSWGGYQPAHRDYQTQGGMNRWIFRCLNVGTRFRELQPAHVEQAFHEAQHSGSAILAFANHDYRDIRPDVRTVLAMVAQTKSRYPDVKVRYGGATAAARQHLAHTGHIDIHNNLQLSMTLESHVLKVSSTAGQCFGPQPFLAYKTRDGRYIHDNFDVQLPDRTWTYVFDAQSLPINEILQIAVGSAGTNASVCTQKIQL